MDIESLRQQGYKVRVTHFRRYLTGNQIPLKQYLHQLSLDKPQEELEIMGDEEYEAWCEKCQDKVRFENSAIMQDNFMVAEWDYLTRGDAAARKISDTLSPRGGITEVRVEKNGKEIAFSSSKCCNTDMYNRKMALRIALGRIEKQLSK